MVHGKVGFFMNWAGTQAGEGYEFHLLAIATLLLNVLATFFERSAILENGRIIELVASANAERIRQGIAPELRASAAFEATRAGSTVFLFLAANTWFWRQPGQAVRKRACADGAASQHSFGTPSNTRSSGSITVSSSRVTGATPAMRLANRRIARSNVLRTSRPLPKCSSRCSRSQ